MPCPDRAQSASSMFLTRSPMLEPNAMYAKCSGAVVASVLEASSANRDGEAMDPLNKCCIMSAKV